MAAKLKPDVTSTLSYASNHLLKTCLRHYLGVFIAFVCLTVLVNATPHLIDPEQDQINVPDKRPARLSYFRPPQSSWRRPSRLSYFRTPYSSSWRRYDLRGDRKVYDMRPQGFGYGNNVWWRKKTVERQPMPWERLPNTNCLRDPCVADSDCCRRFSKCNKRAHVCYDCWYGHPCRSDFDCCAQYPYCNRVLNTCGK